MGWVIFKSAMYDLSWPLPLLALINYFGNLLQSHILLCFLFDSFTIKTTMLNHVYRYSLFIVPFTLIKIVCV